MQQLNGQAQRLIGQQSLSAFTGLQVDIDRIRIDNNGRQDVQRKGGLIIYDGPAPNRETKEAWRRASKEKYGLTQEQLEEVDRQLEEIRERVAKEEGSTVQRDDSLNNLPADFDLMSSDASKLPREDKFFLIRRLRSKLAGMLLGMKRGLGEPDDPNLVSIASLAPDPLVTERKGEEKMTMQPGEVPHKGSFLGCRTKMRKRVTSLGIEEGGKKLGAGGGNKKAAKKSKKRVREESEEEEWEGGDDEWEVEEEEEEGRGYDGPRMDQACSSSSALLRQGEMDGRGAGRSKAKEMKAIGLAADMAALQEMMGISKQQAKAALEICEGDLTMAAEYLLQNLQ